MEQRTVQEIKDEIISKLEANRRRLFNENKTDCSNFAPDGISKKGSACIWPWCDYCSFCCPRKES